MAVLLCRKNPPPAAHCEDRTPGHCSDEQMNSRGAAGGEEARGKERGGEGRREEERRGERRRGEGRSKKQQKSGVCL